MDQWFWVWTVLAAVLFVGEIFTAGFFLLPFGIGAAVAAGLNWLGLGIGWQWAVFLGVSVIALAGLRPLSDRLTHEPPEKMGADRLLGKTGKVVETIEPGDGAGRVRIEREEWRADSANGTRIAEGSAVIVEKIVGTHLVVRLATDAEPKEQ